jgi:predicted unusual protein kinase regulating ubiquinone biosynthesis (AarF/ABC1/UbiB family)
MPMLVARLVRALAIFGVILASYMTQLALQRIFGRWQKRDGRRDLRVLPPWLVERRKRIDTKNARRLLDGMLRLRGVFIKLGQVLSLMGGFLPRVYGKELEQLQDAVPPQPFSTIERAVRKSLGKPIAELFADMASEPIAAASLGQVHVAHLADGRKVAVKVLYPGIRSIIAVDMRVVRWAIVVYRWFLPVTGIERVHEQLVDLLGRETNYIHEAECMERMAKNFAGDDAIAFPSVVHELTTRDVLTMTFMEGIKITKLDELREKGVPTDQVAVRLVQAFYKMMFVDRFFHADPHPGNFLVEPLAGGKFRLVVLDFGAACEAHDALIDGMIEILRGFFGQDDALVLTGFRRMGFVARGGNEQLLERTVKSYFVKLLKIQDRTAAALMRARPDQLEKLADPDVERGELQELMRSFEYPEDWFYVLMFWLAAQVDPTLDTIMVGFPYVMPLLGDQLARVASEPPPRTGADAAPQS